jgi:protein-L-isoaspartate(D-aspartate) O-methyltransferase
MPKVDRPRVLLLWPGGLFVGGANFGIPQILSIAAVCRRAGAEVDVVDLDLERALGPVDLKKIVRRGGPYDLVGISCYSSYDYLKTVAIAEQIRALLPRAWLVSGGYHPSARPDDFTRPESPFDFVVVSDGELPMKRLVEALITGRRPLNRVLGPESVPDPNEIDPVPWELLQRYRPVARKVASLAELYLSRGCPYDCAFCMEKAKRDVSWRPLEPLRAVEELHRLDKFLDLSRWTLFIADALFGMKRSWRREFLEALVKKPIRARKIWLLIRLDLLEREDLELMARANIGPGFGLESGDPEHLKRIRKAGRLHDYLDQMMRVASWCHELHVPFGANVIVGHPGETEQSLRTSAKYLDKLFNGDPRGTMGFLSVDPFRLYPGSPIDEERKDWERDTGMKVHRYPWWEDGDQDFLSEWVDPSGSLDFRTAHRLRRELFAPILSGIQKRFAYQGPARDYFMRSVDEQVDLLKPRRAMRTLGMWHLWKGLLEPERPRLQTLIADDELAEVAREVRASTLREKLPHATPALAAAITKVPRERFVRDEDVPLASDDRPLLLDEGATISALHAYVASFEALDLREGDHLVELGGGTGYGAAVAAEVVGSRGSVRTIEIDPGLHAIAREILAPWPHVEAIEADGHDVSKWRGATKVSVAFAVEAIPRAWIEALGEGSVLVVPVGSRHDQVLTCVRKVADGIHEEPLSRVRYVPDRSKLAASP